MRAPVRQLVNGVILAGGLVLCIVSLVRLQATSPLSWSPSAPRVVAFFGFACLALGAMALAWQRYVVAFFGVKPSFAHAAYQSCMMLVAKYVPVMIAGVVARVAAYTAHARPGRIIFATLVELTGAIGAATIVGLACVAVGVAPRALPVVIALALAGVAFGPALVGLAARVWTAFRRPAGDVTKIAGDISARRAIRAAIALQMLQWTFLAGFVAISVLLVAPSTSASTLAVVAGAYALAVVVGIAIVFLPGGIGAREAAFVWLVSPQIDSAGALQLALALRIAMSVLDVIAGAGCVALHRAGAAPNVPDDSARS